MNAASPTCALEAAGVKLAQIVAEKGLLDVEATVSVAALTAEQAIGHPTRRDFPIITGEEQLIEATVNGAKGHAFTDSPREFTGTLRNVMALPLSSNQNRAVFVAVLNATMRSLGMLSASLHCRDDDPEKCAKELARRVHEQWGVVTVGLIGLNPAIAEMLVTTFGADNVRIADLNPKNIQAVKFGVTIWDGATQTEELIRQSRVVVVTGTTLVNDTFDDIWNMIRTHHTAYLIYGVTAAGVCELFGWDRICPYARNELESPSGSLAP
ncbi:MAG: hypothetical protein KAS72_04675 [Phycisphaerales bacterium]|nr:hypothetical protein [Phycisphaerales bacterium]